MDKTLSDDNRAVEKWENEGGRVLSVNRPTASLKTFAFRPEVNLAARQDQYVQVRAAAPPFVGFS